MSKQVKVTYADGNTVTYDVINADLVRYDLTRARHKWPTMTDAPVLAATFWAYAAAKRNGYEHSWEHFSEQDAVEIDALNFNGEDEPVIP